MNKEDERKEMGISIQRGQVVITFGAQIEWVGLSQGEALAFADVIRQQALLIEPELKLV